MLSAQAAIELDLISQIRALAEKNGTKVFFTRVWRVYDPPLDAPSERFVAGLIPEFLFAPAGFVRESWVNFMDLRHFSYSGQVAYTHWLSEKIRLELHE